MNGKCISTTRIAEICGVSQGTVDRALNNRKGINPRTKEKILAVAAEYGYRPNIHASSIAGGRSRLIGVVVFDLVNQYFSDLLMQIEARCASLGYSTVVMFTDKDHQKEIGCIKSLYHMSVDGIILCPANGGEEYENFLLSLNIPIVTFGNKLNNIPYVGIDNAAAVSESVGRILEKGYRKLIYVKPGLNQKNTFAQKERLDSFLHICKEKGVTYTVTDFYGAESHLTKDTPCVLICPTDIYAIKLFSTAKTYKAGIIGFDNIRIIDDMGLELDSVSYDVELTAKTAVDHIVNGSPISAYVPHKIIKRGSI